MNSRTKTRLEIVSLICAIFLVIISAIPLFNKETDAKLLGVMVGSFGAGAMLVGVIRDMRNRIRKGANKDEGE
jgi:hypothetical protein